VIEGIMIRGITDNTGIRGINGKKLDALVALDPLDALVLDAPDLRIFVP
jgi:hypothetical protein